MATATLTIKDETSGGKIINEINISLRQESVTVKEIIKARVEYEVKGYNEKLPEYFPDPNKTSMYAKRYRQYGDLGDFIEQQISPGNYQDKNRQPVSSAALSDILNHE